MPSQARTLVIDWLRAGKYLNDAADLPDKIVVEIFLERAAECGFTYELIQNEVAGRTLYVVHWAHRGASFVGFKQPPAQDSLEKALLVACSALLQNEWCRSRLG